VRRLGVLAIVSLLVVGATAEVSPVAAAAPPSSGCGHAREPGTRLRRVTVDGWTRGYYLTVPRGYTGNRRVPMIVDLHGQGSTARQEMILTGMRRQAGTRGWITVTPESGRFLWKLPSVTQEDADFLRAVVGDVGRRLCVDIVRRFATGMSNGAGMAADMSCARRLFAAVAPVAGVNTAPPCNDEPPGPIVSFHGTADPNVDYEGRPGLDPVGRRMADWAVRNHCTSGPVTQEVKATVNLIVYRGCDAPVKLYEVEGGGHTWPGGPVLPPAIFGPTNQDIDATARILNFFAAV